MPVVTVLVEFFAGFGNSYVVIISAGSPYIEEICSSFSCSYAFAINAFHPLFVVVVRHNRVVLQFKFWFEVRCTNIILFCYWQNFYNTRKNTYY